MIPLTLFSSASAELLVMALLHFLWQGLALVALHQLVAPLFKRPQSQYVWSCFILFAMPLVVLLTFAFSFDHSLSGFRQAIGVGQTQGDHAGYSPAILTEVVRTGGFVRIALLFWCAGVLLMSIRLFGAWLAIKRMLRRGLQPLEQPWQDKARALAQRLFVRKNFRLLGSTSFESPAVFGCLKPVIVVPLATFCRLTTEQMEAILLHELAHIRRHDYLVNLLQAVVETSLFFHPCVWWISNRIRIEREYCCDDMVVTATEKPVEYARSLTALESLRIQALGQAAAGGSLMERIKRIVAHPEKAHPQLRWTSLVLLLCSAMVMAFVFVACKANQRPIEQRIAEAEAFQQWGEQQISGQDLVPPTSAVDELLGVLEKQADEPYFESTYKLMSLVCMACGPEMKYLDPVSYANGVDKPRLIVGGLTQLIRHCPSEVDVNSLKALLYSWGKKWRKVASAE